MLKINFSIKNRFLNRFGVLGILAFLSLGCQVKPTLLDTPNFIEGQESRFYLHTDNPKEGGHDDGLHVFIDDVELVDFKQLDSEGLELKEGTHQVKLVDDKARSEKTISYNAKRGQENHLVYCEATRNYHWYTMPVNPSHPDFKEKSIEICNKLEFEKGGSDEGTKNN